jgi:transposase-like protein
LTAKQVCQLAAGFIYAKEGVAQVAADLGISDQLLYNWWRAIQQDRQGFRGTAAPAG